MIATTGTCPLIEARETSIDGHCDLSAKQNQFLQELSSEKAWVVEVEDDGTIIHSRSNGCDANRNSLGDMTGQNFFEDVSGLTDKIRCWQHFRTFVKSKRAVESFIWPITAERGLSEAKVQMTRAFRTSTFPPTGVVMMEIRAIGGRDHTN